MPKIHGGHLEPQRFLAPVVLQVYKQRKIDKYREKERYKDKKREREKGRKRRKERNI